MLFVEHSSRGMWFYSCSRPSPVTDVCKVMLTSVAHVKDGGVRVLLDFALGHYIE